MGNAIPILQMTKLRLVSDSARKGVLWSEKWYKMHFMGKEKQTLESNWVQLLTFWSWANCLLFSFLLSYVVWKMGDINNAHFIGLFLGLNPCKSLGRIYGSQHLIHLLIIFITSLVLKCGILETISLYSFLTFFSGGTNCLATEWLSKELKFF